MKILRLVQGLGALALALARGSEPALIHRFSLSSAAEQILSDSSKFGKEISGRLEKRVLAGFGNGSLDHY